MTSSQKSQERQRLPINWITALFAKFQVRYGHKWFSQIDGVEEIAVNEWADYLHGLTGEQIKKGLDGWDGDWPPSAAEFKKACQDKKDEFGIGYIPECYRETKRERLIESDENKAKHKAAYESVMKGLKNILKKS